MMSPHIPKTAWEYRLGNRSALEWILDQYKEKKPKDETIAKQFNNYRFADYKEQVINTEWQAYILPCPLL
ncbi:hypothetical protein L2E81_18410 [Planktothrix agardhii 1033]|nr:hypothetical protein [Planktothrix agardhii 1033]